MQISETVAPIAGAEPCRFPKLEECAHFHYEKVQLGPLTVTLQTNMDQSLHSQHGSDETADWYTLQVSSSDECWLIQRSFENFTMLDEQLHQCIYDRKVSQLLELTMDMAEQENLEVVLSSYLEHLCRIIDNSLNCGPILNWFQLDNRGHRLLVPSEESRSINTPAVAAAYSIRKYVSQARDELSLEVGDMISVIDMASPGESVWWRGKRGFQVGFFPQHCVHIIGDKVPRNMPLPPPVVGSLALSPIKPVLRKHGKLITFFRSFILNRPSRRRLKQSGILKERVFGCDLGEHLLNSGHEIPMVLKCCAEFIEKNGIVDGIYRLSGVTSNIQKLRNAFDEDRIPNLYTDDILQDIHSVASLLKMYFRELPNPLCTYQLYQSFVAAVQGCTTTRSKANDNERLLKMREAVQKLPPPHYRTLEYLMRHLARVAKHGASTGMTTRNVAIVWAPNLLRCEELEIGGVAALQGVGVQAVVTEFLICYSDLIFCDHLPSLADTSLSEVQVPVSPKRCRPKSLAISTPTKLLTLEEARNKHLLNKSDDGNYIEVGGGPKNLPKKYHTIIELPAGSRKRSLTKRSPSGWRSFFSKSRNSSHGNLSKHIEISPPGAVITEKSVTESDLTEIKRKLRPVKSAESLTSGQSEPTPCENDVLGPLYSLNKPPGHNRSVSHDSYFDNLQSSTNNSVGSLLDLSEIQLNFELEESEMRIFSEDESLVSSPKVQRESASRKMLTRARPEDFSSAANSSNPSPKKQARVVVSPESLSRKRSRLEDQLSDIQYIDCNTPDNPCLISTTAMIHNMQEEGSDAVTDQYQPKNKSPRNSHALNRHSLNFENMEKINIPKSLTEMDIGKKLNVPGSLSSAFTLSPTPGTPNYKPLDNSSEDTTPILSPDLSPDIEIRYQNLNRLSDRFPNYEDDDNKRPTSCYSLPEKRIYENVTPVLTSKSVSPTYENVLTTISIIYKSPTKVQRNNSESIYEDVELNPEKAVVPTNTASLPVQEASQPNIDLKRPTDLKLVNTIHVNKQEDEMESNGFTKSGTYKSMESYSSTPISPKSPENSKKSLISLTEYSFTENVISPISEESSSSGPARLQIQSSNNSENSSSSNGVLRSPTRDVVIARLERESPNRDISEHYLNTRSPVSERLSSNRDISSDLERSNLHRLETSSVLEVPSPNRDASRTYLDRLSPYRGSSPISERLSPNLEMTYSLNSDKLTSNSSDSNSKKESVSPVHLSHCSSPSLDSISPADAQTHNSSMCNSSSSPSCSLQSRSSSRNSNITKSTEEISSLSVNKTNNSNNDKRKSCDDEVLDDQNAIYQQVKYFRRSIHEINSLLDITTEDNTNPILPTAGVNTNATVETECGPVAENDQKHEESSSFQMDSIENFDSLEAENVHVYENIEIPKNHKDLDVPRSRMHDCEPKKLEISPEIVQDIPLCSKCLPVENTKQQVASTVKSLTSRFEKTKDLEDKVEKLNMKDDTSEKKVNKNYDKDGLPPCLRAKNAKNSVKTKSLDENAFVTEFGRPPNQLQRRKSLDDRTSSYINSKLLIEPKQIPSRSTLDVSQIEKIQKAAETIVTEQKLNRERIEKYKEERRNFLREKYRSESFREDKDKILSRLKQKSFNSKKNDSVTTEPSQALEYKDMERTRLTEPETKVRENNSCFKKLPVEALSKFEKDGAICKTTFKKHTSSPISEKRNRPSWKEISATILDDTNSEDTVVIRGKEEEFIRHRRGDSESEKRRHTYDLLQEREFDSETHRRISLDTKNPRKEKCSPSYCIKDMKAIFESKSQQ